MAAQAKGNSFYDELANRNFYEKTASTQEQIKTALEAFTTDEMEAIAAELGLLSEKTAADEEGSTSLESVMTQVDKKEQEDSRDKANESKVEGGEGKTDESETTQGEGSEDAKTNAEKKEAVNDEAAAVAGTKDGANTDTGSNDSSAGANDGSTQKEAAEGEEEVPASEEKKEDEKKEEEKEEGMTDDEKVATVLAAYDLAAEKLASQGYTLQDYVIAKVGDEKIAAEVAEYAEKLAFVTEQNSLKVADDIIETMYNMLSQE